MQIPDITPDGRYFMSLTMRPRPPGLGKFRGNGNHVVYKLGDVLRWYRFDTAIANSARATIIACSTRQKD